MQERAGCWVLEQEPVAAGAAQSKQRRALHKHPELPWPWTLHPALGTPSWRGRQQNGVPGLPLPGEAFFSPCQKKAGERGARPQAAADR